jgi:N6-L-threonylcarbamoyladenine synthase
MKEILTLAIDTSCDETSVAVVKGLTILSNLLPSQAKMHSEFGGVVPSLAKLAHQERIDKVVESAVKRAGVAFEELDQIAVTKGPGLAIALEVGIRKAKELAIKYKKPLVAVNHMEGHLLSSFAIGRELRSQFPTVVFPVIGLLVSGGHTEILLIKNFGEYEKIGETLDDACGEAFDKCGRMLGLGYPAGPVISKFARLHRKNMSIKTIKKDKSVLVRCTNKKTKKTYDLPISMANSGDLNFSYSGLKTAFHALVNKENNLTLDVTKDLAVAFEAAAFAQIEIKLRKAIEKYSPSEIWLGGGVVASARLRHVVRKIAGKDIKVRAPFTNKLTGDNAAMIAVAANISQGISKKGRVIFTNPKDFDQIDREPNLSF